MVALALAGCDDSQHTSESSSTSTGSDTTTSSTTSSSSGTGGGAAALPIDCCDPAHKDSATCRSADPGGGELGSGPQVSGFLAGVASGFVEGGKAILAVKNTGASAGMVLSVDLATGNREVITGVYEDPMAGPNDQGGGDTVNPIDVVRGPDGFYLLAETGGDVYRADFATGKRALVYDTSACTTGAATLVRGSDAGLEVDEAGALYQSANAGPSLGVVRLFQGACSVVTFADRTDGVGSGPNFLTYTGMGYAKGKLFGTWFTDESLISVDVATAKRLRLSSTTMPTVGSGPPFGTASTRASTDGSVWVGADSQGGVALVTRVVVDLNAPNVGDREPFNAECGPLTSFEFEDVYLYGELGSFWVIGKDSAVYLFDPATKNSNRLSR